jgi:hypothetical protein
VSTKGEGKMEKMAVCVNTARPDLAEACVFTCSLTRPGR